MVINDSMVWDGKKYKLIWHDADSFDDLNGKTITQSYGVCFCDNKLVIVSNNGKWSLVGGHLESGRILVKLFFGFLY